MAVKKFAAIFLFRKIVYLSARQKIVSEKLNFNICIESLCLRGFHSHERHKAKVKV